MVYWMVRCCIDCDLKIWEYSVVTLFYLNSPLPYFRPSSLSHCFSCSDNGGSHIELSGTSLMGVWRVLNPFTRSTTQICRFLVAYLSVQYYITVRTLNFVPVQPIEWAKRDDNHVKQGEEILKHELNTGLCEDVKWNVIEKWLKKNSRLDLIWARVMHDSSMINEVSKCVWKPTFTVSLNLLPHGNSTTK